MATGRIVADQIAAPLDELFYWLAILASNTLGTTLGDFTADVTGLNLGFEYGALLFAVLIGGVAVAYGVRMLPLTLLFWAAYVLTRPLGATLGDTLTKQYWLAILLASAFGTNAGDLYAHDSGLGVGPGLVLLMLLATAAFLAEKRDRIRHVAWYWLVIVIIRTGATNVGDMLAYRFHVPVLVLAASLVAVIALLSWRASAQSSAASGLPETGAAYWAMMLAAGVFGTVVGDVCSQHFAGRKNSAISAGSYWVTVLTARTAATCLGDCLAESKSLHVGLPLSTLLTGTALVAAAAFRPAHPIGSRDRVTVVTHLLQDAPRFRVRGDPRPCGRTSAR